MNSNTIKNYINCSFQITSIGQSNNQSILKQFSLIAVATLRPFCKPAMCMLLLLMILPLAMVKPVQAQETQSVSGDSEQSFDLTPKTENITRPKTENIISSKIKDILSSSVFEQPSACTQSQISYGQTVFGRVTTSDCVVNGNLSKEYTFSGSFGQQINISSYSYQFYTSLQLINSSGTVVSTGGSQISFTLSSTGTYTIRVSDSGQDSFYPPNLIGGDYYLSLAQGVSACVYQLPYIGIGPGTTGATTSSISMTTTAGCPWTAVSNDPSITITSPASGVGSTTVAFSIAAYNSSTPRRTTITVAGLALSIFQDSNLPCSVTAISYGQTKNGDFSTSDCNNYASYGDKYTFSGTAGDQIAISTIPGTISPGGIYLRLTLPSGTVPFDFSYSQIPSSGRYTLPESGIYTIFASAANHFDRANATGSYTISLTNSSTCTYSLSPTSASVSASGGTFNFGITAPAGCAWTATSNATSWLTTSSSGSGNGTISYTAAANTTTSSRTGTITVGGQTFTVTQAAAPQTYTVSGRVTINGVGLPDVNVNLGFAPIPNESNGSESNNDINSPNVSVLTNSNGDYTFTNVSSGFYIITPTKTGYSFTPQSLTYNTNATPAPANFTAQLVCNYSVNPTSSSISASGGTFNFGITAPAGCAWTATSNATSWLTTSSSGSGNGTINYTVAANTNTSSRTGTITVGGQTFTITQQAACTYSLSQNSSTVPAAGGLFSFNVTTAAGCPVSVSSNVSWLTASSSGSGSGTITYSVDPNTATSLRNGVITVSGQTFTVTQQAAVGCTYTLNPTSASIAAVSSNGSFIVTTAANCSWTAISNSNWLVSSGSGTGTGTVLYTATANTTAASRTGTITAAGQTFTVTQAAPPACNLTINPTSQIIEATSGTYSFNVFVNAGCAWTATTSTPWIHPAAGGSGNGSANYTVDANTGNTSRQGTITVNGQVFTVSQKSPANPTYSISGRVTQSDGNNGTIGLSGVTITLYGAYPGATTTDSSGNYRFNNLTPANYTVEPALAGALFGPVRSTVPFLNSDQTADFSLAVCSYSLSNSTDETTTGESVPNTESSGGFKVKAQNCGSTPWKAISNVPWVIVGNEGNGAGTQAVGYFVQRNYGAAARAGTITVNGQIYTINQAGLGGATFSGSKPQDASSTCSVSLNQASGQRQLIFSSDATTGSLTGSFAVTTTNQGIQPSCQWSAKTSDTSWITIINPANELGANNQSVTFSVKENTGIPRFGVIQVNGQPFYVVQKSGITDECQLNLTPGSSGTYTPEGGSGFFNVVFNSSNPIVIAGCSPWQSFNPILPWLTVAGGTDTENVHAGKPSDNYEKTSFTVGANTGTEARTGAIVVRDKAFTITQPAGQAANCRWAFSTPAQNFAAEAGAGSVNVSTGTGCTWNAAPPVNAPWLHLTNKTGDTDGTVRFTVDANSGAARSGTIVIDRDQTVSYTVTQAAAQTCSYTIDPGFRSIAAIGAAGTIQVTASSVCSGQRTAASNVNWITVITGANGSGSGAVSYVAQTNPTTAQRVGTITIEGQKFTVTQAAGNAPVSNTHAAFDFDGDGKADVSVFRPGGGFWYLLNSTAGFTGAQFGAATDKLAAADYDGDGKTDLAVYRTGTWFIQRSTQGFTGVAFGESTDIPVPGDYDGDGKTDIAVYRPSNGVWYIYNLTTNQFNAAQFGISTDKPVPGDYDGDGKTDIAVFRPSNGTWYLNRSSLGFTGMQFGDAADKPVVGDYDGDGKSDIAVFRPSNGVWYLQRSQAGFTGIQFGLATDLPTPADYDGDGKTDIAVFRSGTWYLQRSTQGFTGVSFGNATDKPVPNSSVPQ